MTLGFRMKTALILLLFCLASEADDLRFEVQDLHQRFKSEMEGQHAALVAEVERLKSIVTTLQTQNQEKSKVAFSAGFGGDGNTGPFNTEITLKYSQVHTNIGNGYNSFTGIFTAPVRGLYHFSYYHHHSPIAHGGGSHANLYKNTQRIASTAGYSSVASFNSANGVTVQLERGDLVYVKLHAGAWLFDNHDHFSNFNGMLLFTL